MMLKSILIIDDDRNLRQSMALILRRAGYQVDMAASGPEALADLEGQEYDLAILDLMVPDDGSMLLPRILRLYPGQPILILTAEVSPETHDEARHRGKHARLVKPVTPEILLENVRKILRTASGPNHAHLKAVDEG